MRPRLMQWLVCPLCSGDLKLAVCHQEKKNIRADDLPLLQATTGPAVATEIEIDVTLGALTCSSCAVYYPIFNGIPRMLTYPTRVATVHAQAARDWIADELRGFNLPHKAPPKGERRILRNFSTEWLGYRWTGDTYWNVTPDNMLRCKRYELGVSAGDLKGKLLLEVGIGIGGTADALSRTEQCEVVGMDLGYAVDQAHHYFGRNPMFHIVQASVFAPPFRAGSFDVVYSHGVIHHTYSTPEAFNRLTRLPKAGGGMLYIWVYSHEQEKATVVRRGLMLVERILRPLLSRLPTMLQTALLAPIIPLYIVYQNLYRRKKLGEPYAARYRWNEAVHAARDRFTPPFAFRHTYEEVVRWFRADGYADIQLLRDEPLPEGVPDTYQINIGVRGRRSPFAGSAVTNGAQ